MTAGRMGGKRATSIDLEVGRRIRPARLQAGMSQTDLADQIGVTFQQVQKYEKGANRLGAGRLSQVAQVLNHRVSDFFDETGEQKGAAVSVSPAGLLSGPYVLRLVQAFTAFPSVETRRTVVHLVETMADAAAERTATKTENHGPSRRRPAKTKK